MDVYSSQITNLVEQLSHLPGIGAKSAQRLAFHILNMTEEQVAGLSGAMMSAKKNVHYCKECCTYTDGEICPICANSKRNHRQIMVVENTRDLAANLTACTMYFMERFLRWQELARMIFVCPS